MSVTKYLNPKNDRAFKRIFGSEGNKDILIHFLNDIFDRINNPIKEVTIEKTSQDPKAAGERISFVDVFCKDAQGHHFIVEMQVASDTGFLKRAQYYAAKAYIDQRDQGNNYKDLKEVIFLAITDFTIFPSKPDYLSHHAMLDKKTYEQDLKDFSFSFLELPKFKKKQGELVTLIEKWTFFLKYAPATNETDVALVAGADQIIAKAYDVVNRFYWTKEELAAYEEADMQRITYTNSLEAAQLEGEEGDIGIGKAAVAKSMLAAGYKVEEITKLTGLSKDQLDSL
jgi:predicted transposase/invertase (TIGR01784 family)